MENQLFSYVYDSTLIAIVTSPGVRVSVAESLNRDLTKVSEWCECDIWGMALNANKTTTMTVSRSPTIQPSHPNE